MGEMLKREHKAEYDGRTARASSPTIENDMKYSGKLLTK
jgi:hypothetical protein